MRLVRASTPCRLASHGLLHEVRPAAPQNLHQCSGDQITEIAFSGGSSIRRRTSGRHESGVRMFRAGEEQQQRGTWIGRGTQAPGACSNTLAGPPLQSTHREGVCRVDSTVHLLSPASTPNRHGPMRSRRFSVQPCNRAQGGSVHSESGVQCAGVSLFCGAAQRPRRPRPNSTGSKASSRAAGAFRSEVEAVLGQLWGAPWLMGSLLYGSGLRVSECAELRVKDLDFDRREITVRDGKGRRDRRTLLPGTVANPLREHLASVKQLHKRDLASGAGYVACPATSPASTATLRPRGLLSMEGFGTGRGARSVVAVGNRDVETIDTAARQLLESLVDIDEEHRRFKFKIGGLFEHESSEIVRNFIDGRHLPALQRLLAARGESRSY